MVKKTQKAQAPKQEVKVEETSAVEESVTVQTKIENDKNIKKQIKEMTAQVN